MSIDNWQEAGGASDEVWKPENAGDELIGKLVRRRENVGANSSNMYYLEQEAANGEKLVIAVWGSTVLDTKFDEIPLQAQVKIEYLGTVKGKGPKPYKDFKVLYKVPDDWAGDAAKQLEDQEQ